MPRPTKYRFPANSLAGLCNKDKKQARSAFGITSRDRAALLTINPRGFSVNSSHARRVCSPASTVKAISLFSGAGGLDLGAHRAGIQVIAALDYDKDAVATLKANRVFAKTEVFHQSVTNTTARTFEQPIGRRRPSKLVVIGGPPCQPFSKAGYWITNSRRLGSLDPRNMIGHYLRIIDELRPDGFLLENVESILHPTNAHVATYIEDYVTSLGYNLLIYRADALNFGVPQKRRRVFFMGSLKRISGQPSPTHGSADERLANLKLLPFERAVDWIARYDTPTYSEPGESFAGQTYAREASQVPPGRNYFALTERDGHPSPRFKANTRFWSFLLKLHPFEPSWTIPAQPGPWVGPLHWNNRRLRGPEIAALQTFPCDYIITGSRRAIQRQVGNAVPPLLGEAMLRFLVKHL